MICPSLGQCFLMDLRLTSGEEITAWAAFRLSLRESRVMAVVLLRVSQWLAHKRFWWRLAPYMKRLNEVLNGFECHLSAEIDEGLFIAHTQGIVIGEGVVLGKRVTIFNGVTFGALARGAEPAGGRYPRVGDEVVVYTGAKLIGPIVVGRGATIGANAVVLSDVPQGCVAVGVPARVLPAKSQPVGLERSGGPS